MDAAPAPGHLWRRRSLRTSAAGAFVPAPFRVADRRRDTADTWTLALEPLRWRLRRRAGAVRDGVRVRGRRGADLGQRPSRAAGRARRPHGARRRRGRRTRSAARSRARCSACAARSATAGRSRRAAGGDVVVVAGGIGLAPLRPVVLHVLAQRAELRRGLGPLRRAHAGGPALYATSSRPGATSSPSRSRSTRRTRPGPGRRRRRAAARRPGGLPSRGGERVRLRARGDDALHRRGAAGARRAGRADLPLARAGHALRRRPLRPLPARADPDLPRRPRLHAGDRSRGCWRCGSCEQARSSPSGSSPPATAASSRCSTSRTSCSRSPARSRSPTSARRRARWPTGRTTSRSSRARSRRRTTPSGSRRSGAPRRRSSPSARARPSGGIQALRNFADVDEFTRIVYASPQYISTLATSTPISDHVTVDFELHGCPIDKRQLLEVVTAFLDGRRPGHPGDERLHRVQAARRRLRHGRATATPCLGPVTQAGCGALCPSYDRGCYGCFGPMESPNTGALVPLLRRLGPERPRRRAPLPARSTRRGAVPEGGPEGDGACLSGRSSPTTSRGSRARAR